MDVTLNSAQRLYVMDTGAGYCTLGFDVLYARACELAKRLIDFAATRPGAKTPDMPSVQEIGTLAQYQQYKDLLSAYRGVEDHATWYDSTVPYPVRREIDYAIANNRRVRLFLGDPKTGRDWAEEHDVMGYVSRSMGPMRTPILLARSSSHGGGSILCANVLKIVDIQARRVLYQHARYSAPKLRLVDQGGGTDVYRDDMAGKPEVLARCDTHDKAQAYADFILGKTFRYPTKNERYFY